MQDEKSEDRNWKGTWPVQQSVIGVQASFDYGQRKIRGVGPGARGLVVIRRRCRLEDRCSRTLSPQTKVRVVAPSPQHQTRPLQSLVPPRIPVRCSHASASWSVRPSSRSSSDTLYLRHTQRLSNVTMQMRWICIFVGCIGYDTPRGKQKRNALVRCADQRR